MPGGRPSKLTPEILEAARSYAAGGWSALGHAVPSIVGLANSLNLAESTLYRWAEEDEDSDRPEFWGILEKVRSDQHFTLINKGLNKEISEGLTKLLLVKHGHHDKAASEVSGPNGGPIAASIMFTGVASDGRRSN